MGTNQQYYIETEQGIQAMTAEELPLNSYDIFFSWTDKRGNKHPKYLDEYTQDLMWNFGVLREIKIESIRDKDRNRSHVPVMMCLYVIDGKYYTSGQVPYGEGSRVYAKTKKVEVWMRR